MFGAYVRLKCNFAALRRSSDNQQQHLLLGQRWVIGNTMWSVWLSTSSQRRILDSRSFSVLAFYVDEQQLVMYTYKVETQQSRRW